MNKSQLANQKVMKKYLSELLTDDVIEAKKNAVDVITIPKTKISKQRLEKLFEDAEQIDGADIAKVSKVETSQPILQDKLINNLKENKKNTGSEDVFKQKHNITSNINKISNEQKYTPINKNADGKLDEPKKYRQGGFQAMFFDVAGLLIAVPLIELGGIHNKDKTNSLMGKPAWFEGVMIHRDEQINVVDTALWVMPEKCDDSLLNALEYQYVIMLGNSKWGLLAEKLVDTVTLEQDDVKWLDKPSKRPWLAGLVREKMCALLNVDALIKLLDDGACV